MKEVTIKIGEDAYEYYKRLGEQHAKSIEEIIVETIRGFYEWDYCEDEGEI